MSVASRSLSLSLFIALSPLAQGQTPAPQAVQFNENWTAVPKAFRGDDIAALAKRVSADKGEFETTEAYLKRFLGRRVVFVLEPTDDQDVFGVKYNADKKQFNVALLLSPYCTLKIAEVKKNPRWVQNALGTSWQMHDIIKNEYRIQFVNDFINYFEVHGKSKIIEMPPSQAAKTKYKLLLTARLAPANGTKDIFYNLENHYTDGDFYNPINLTENIHCIYTEFESAWIYDDSTGKVIEKFNINNYNSHIAQIRTAIANEEWKTAQEIISQIPESDFMFSEIKDKLTAKVAAQNKRIRDRNQKYQEMATKIETIQSQVRTLIEENKFDYAKKLVSDLPKGDPMVNSMKIEMETDIIKSQARADIKKKKFHDARHLISSIPKEYSLAESVKSELKAELDTAIEKVNDVGPKPDDKTVKDLISKVIPQIYGKITFKFGFRTGAPLQIESISTPHESSAFVNDENIGAWAVYVNVLKRSKGTTSTGKFVLYIKNNDILHYQRLWGE